jgi:hypothetical protein
MLPTLSATRALGVAVSLLFYGQAHATTWIVDPGGGGDATTIAGGLALASGGDHVQVAAGTYAEHDLQLKPSVTLESQSGAAATIIDAGHLGHGVIGADDAVLRGFTIVHAGTLNHFAVYCNETSPDIFDNVIRDNDERAVTLFRSSSMLVGNEIHANPATFSSAVVVVQSSPVIAGNRIFADDPNGNVNAIEVSFIAPGAMDVPLIEDNEIVGRIYISDLDATATMEVRRNVCTVLNGFSEAINIAFSPGPLVIHHNTIIGGSGIFGQGSSVATITNNIVAHAATDGIIAFGATFTVECNDFWDNQTDYAGGANNFSADPLFCDESGGDYGLREDSPCTALNSPAGCGLVGARDVACASTLVARESWGAIKSKFR